MSSPAGTVFPQDHPRLNVSPSSMMMPPRQNGRDGKRWSLPMPEFPNEGAPVETSVAGTTNGDIAAIMENIQNKKQSLLSNRQQSAFAAATTSATSAATANEKHTSSTSSSSTSSAQMVTTSHSASSSSASRHSSKRQQMIKSMSTSEMNLKKLNSESFAAASAENRIPVRSMSIGLPMGAKLPGASQRVISEEPIPIVEEMSSDLVPVLPGGVATVPCGTAAATALQTTASASSTHVSHSLSEMKFQQKQTSTSKEKVVTDGFSVEKIAATKQDVKRIQTGDVSFEEKHTASAVKKKLETEAFCAEKTAAVMEEQYQMKAGDFTQQEQNRATAASMKFSSGNMIAEKTAMAKQAERQTITSHGVTHQETHMAASSSSKLMFTSAKGVSTSACQSSLLSGQMGVGMLCGPNDWLMSVGGPDMSDLDLMTASSGADEVGRAVAKYKGLMSKFIDRLRQPSIPEHEATGALQVMDGMIRKAWAVPSHGNTLGYSLCDVLREEGGLGLLIDNCSSSSGNIQFCSARVLEQCLVTQNRAIVVDSGLDQVVMAAKRCSENRCSYEHTRVGTGILAHLFKHSESTCGQVIKMGGLDAIVEGSKGVDVDTLRHCASALANLSLYGGLENHQSMIKRNVPFWLFPLAFNPDDNIKYYACLALVALVANKEIEAHVLRSGTLNLVEPFIDSHNPAEFAMSSVAHVHGQSKEWLQRLVPVLNSKRKEARNLAAFHFAMEAGIKKKQGITDIFREIGAIEPLKKAASSPNALASKYAAQALRLIGETIPHKLTQQVPLWSVEDVVEWLKQIGFSGCTQEFKNSRVDGDLLLQLTERMLLDDIGIKNGILRKRFMRELGNLKKMTDYSSCDSTNLNDFLQSIGPELPQYTYPLLQSGVDKDVLRCLSDEQLQRDCGIENSIHRLRILESIKGGSVQNICDDLVNKDLDVFISYRRSTGSQLASLLKVHLQLRGFSVFIDVERLEAGKFDNNLLQSIRQAKHFILILTPTTLDRCIGDEEKKDWVHREIVAALQSQCNIIPITDNFQWPEPEQLPEDMRAVSYFNGVRWIHDYQDACVEKLERFMRGDIKGTDVVQGRYGNVVGGNGTPGTPSVANGRGAPYQRSQSNESKGSVGSDNGKDSYNNTSNNTNGVEITLIE